MLLNNSKMAMKFATFKIGIKHPESGQTQDFTHSDDYDSITLTRLMNFLAFANDDKEKFNANFMSIYNEAAGEFEYIVERLIGFSVQEVKSPIASMTCSQWRPYINGERKEWHGVHDKEVHVSAKDEILWVFE